MRLCIPAVALSICWCLLPAATASADSAVQCTSLHVTLSPDKNYYIFTAASAGDTQTVTEYTFHFGDRQTYTASFGTSAGQNRAGASATHVYQEAGSYTPSVQVLTTTNGKRAAVSSPACQASLTIPPAGTSLPNTGASHTLQLFAGASLAGFALHQLRLRRHTRTHSRT